MSTVTYEEIDVRRYARLIARNWLWILLTGILFGVIVFIALSQRPAVYSAEATVAGVRSRTDVNFDTRIDFVSEAELNSDAGARRAALIALAESGSLAAEILDEIGSELPSGQRNVDSLLRMVSSEGRGDLILILARHRDPDVAALVANSWAAAFVDLANAVYGGTEVGDSAFLEPELAAARDNYATAQAAYEEFVGRNEIDILTREITATQRLLDLQASANADLAAALYAELVQIEGWQAAAEALGEQVAADAGSDTANLANTISLISLRNAVYGSGEGLQLQADLGAENVSRVTAADVDGLIEALVLRRAALEERIAEVTTGTSLAGTGSESGGDTVTVAAGADNLKSRLMALQVQLETQSAEQRELQGRRDLAWDAYQALNQEQAEETIASQTSPSVVRLAALAYVPAEPEGSQRLLITAAAALFGMALAVAAVLALAWWREGQAASQA